MSSFSSQPDKLKIHEWLTKVFENEKIPPFEETEEAFESLKKIMARNLEIEKNTKEIIMQEQKLTEIYNKRSEDLASLLDCGFLSLSSQSSEAINRLAGLAKDMNLKEPTHTNFLLAICEAENKKIENAKMNKTIQYHLSALSQKYANTIKTNEILKRDFNKLEKAVELLESRDLKIKVHVSYFEKKYEEYQKRIKNSEKNLEDIGCEPPLHHHVLVEQYQKIQELEDQLNSLVTKLESYESLPPNEELASFQVQEAKQEAIRLETELDQKLLELNSR